MTIEIKQLIIRAVVEDRRAVSEPVYRTANRTANHTANYTANRAATVDRESVIAACMRQVLRELRKERGR